MHIQLVNMPEYIFIYLLHGSNTECFINYYPYVASLKLLKYTEINISLVKFYIFVIMIYMCKITNLS